MRFTEGEEGPFDAANLTSGTATDGYVLTADGLGGAAWELAGAEANTYHYILIRDEKTQNTNGGTFTAGDWQTRDLNTESADTGNYASVASNQITLAAGTYRVKISCPAYAVNQHQARLQNITDAETTLIGTGAYSVNATTAYVSNCSFIDGRFTIAAETVFEVQHRCATTRSTNGYGVTCNFGTEVYTVVELWREP